MDQLQLKMKLENQNKLLKPKLGINWLRLKNLKLHNKL